MATLPNIHSTTDWGEREITITLKGKEWFALMAALKDADKGVLSSYGRKIYQAAEKRLTRQISQTVQA